MHTLSAKLRFRMLAITYGYKDADDCDALRKDPLFNLAVDGAPEGGRDLCSQPGSHLTDLQHPWRRIRPRAELDDVNFHDLRHSFASPALALGEDLPMIGRLPVHMEVQTTARYAHLARDTVKTSAARIGDCINGDLETVEWEGRGIVRATLLYPATPIRLLGAGEANRRE